MSRNDVIIGVAALVLVVFSLVVSIVVPRRDPNFPGRKIGIFTVVAITLVVITLASVELAGETHEAEGAEHGGESVATETGSGTETGGTETGGGAQGDVEAGKAVFTANCGSCHTLQEAGTSGTVGPNLDELSLTVDRVVQQVTNGGGAMPPFGGQLSEQDIQNVAAFVVASQG